MQPTQTVRIFLTVPSEDTDVAWMPAHTPLEAVGVLRLGNCEVLTHQHRNGNMIADVLAKKSAALYRIPGVARAQREAVRPASLYAASLVGSLATLQTITPGPPRLRMAIPSSANSGMRRTPPTVPRVSTRPASASHYRGWQAEEPLRPQQ